MGCAPSSASTFGSPCSRRSTRFTSHRFCPNPPRNGVQICQSSRGMCGWRTPAAAHVAGLPLELVGLPRHPVAAPLDDDLVPAVGRHHAEQAVGVGRAERLRPGPRPRDRRRPAIVAQVGGEVGRGLDQVRQTSTAASGAVTQIGQFRRAQRAASPVRARSQTPAAFACGPTATASAARATASTSRPAAGGTGRSSAG